MDEGASSPKIRISLVPRCIAHWGWGAALRQFQEIQVPQGLDFGQHAFRIALPQEGLHGRLPLTARKSGKGIGQGPAEFRLRGSSK